MFFSVKRALKIAGKTYIPCICYPVTKFLERTVNKLSDEGKAVIYEDRVFFQNGKVIEKAEVILEQPVIKENLTTEKPVVKENLTTEKPKKTKKEKREEVDEAEGF